MNATSGSTEILIKNEDVYNNTYNTDFGGTESASFGLWAARYAGDMGDSLKVSLCAADRERLTLTGTGAYDHTGGSAEKLLTQTSGKLLEELMLGDVLSMSVSPATK